MKFYTDLEMVNRFSGASASSESLPPGFTRSGDTVTKATASNISATGYYVIKNAVVDLNGRTTLTADGVHISFYNCVVNINDTSDSPLGLTGYYQYGAGANNSGDIISGVSGNQANSRTFNFYGCTVYQKVAGLNSSSRSNYFVADFLDSNWYNLEGNTFAYMRNGSRVNNNNTSHITAGSNWELSSDAPGLDLSAIEFSGNRLFDFTYFNWGQGDSVVSNLEVASNGTPVIYAIGEGDKSYSPSILSLNPVTKISGTGNCRYDQSTNINVRNGRIYESLKFDPIVSSDVAGTTKIQGAKCRLTLPYGFSSTQFNSINGTPLDLDYESDSNGELVLQGSPTIPFGDDFPVVVTRQAQHTGAASFGDLYFSQITDYDSTIQVRQYENRFIKDGAVAFEYNLAVDNDLTYTDFDGLILVGVAEEATTLTAVQAAALTEANTNDEAFAAAKLYWAGDDDYATTTFWYDIVGGQLQIEDRDLILDSTETNVFSLTGADATLKSTTFTGGVAATTGTVTTQNGTLLSGGTFDCDINYQSGASTTLTNVTINNTIDFDTAGTYVLDGCTINEVTNSSGGAITLNLVNGSTVTTNTGSNITLEQLVNITAPNIIDGSRVQIYNVTKSAEIDNSVVSGGSGYTFAANLLSVSVDEWDVLRLRASYVVWLDARENIETQGVITVSGLSFIDTQVDDEIYIANAVDGSTITKFESDYIDDEVDIIVSGNFTSQELYAWFLYNETTTQGIQDFFGGLIANDAANYEFKNDVVNLYLDNDTTTNEYQNDNARIYRTDGAYPVKNPTTGGWGLDINWRERVLIAETGTSGLTPTESARLFTTATQTDITSQTTNIKGVDDRDNTEVYDEISNSWLDQATFDTRMLNVPGTTKDLYKSEDATISQEDFDNLMDGVTEDIKDTYRATIPFGLNDGMKKLLLMIREELKEDRQTTKDKLEGILKNVDNIDIESIITSIKDKTISREDVTILLKEYLSKEDISSIVKNELKNKDIEDAEKELILKLEAEILDKQLINKMEEEIKLEQLLTKLLK